MFQCYSPFCLQNDFFLHLSFCLLLIIHFCFLYFFKDGPLDIHHLDSEGEGTHLPDLEEDCDTFVPRPPWFGTAPAAPPTSKLKKLRLKGKDYRKGGDGLRGKNVTEAYRVKEKDLKRIMK